MIFIYITLGIITLLLIIILIISLKATNNKDTGLTYKLDSLHGDIQRIESSVKNEIGSNRKETFDNAALARKELAASLFSFEEKLNHLTNTIDHKLTAFSEANTTNV
ncbi:MAG: rmuC [Segetibacter sp.]|nr:rmuC [Segetibacter sp.]